MPSACELFVVCPSGAKEGFPEAVGRLEGKLAHNREMKVRAITRREELGGCHVVLLGASPRRVELLSAAARMPALTISDQPEFAQAGGIIELGVRSDRVVFDINLDAARGTGLRICSQVLRLARRVTDTLPREAR